MGVLEEQSPRSTRATFNGIKRDARACRAASITSRKFASNGAWPSYYSPTQRVRLQEHGTYESSDGR